MLLNIVSWKKFKQVKQDWQPKSDVKIDYDTITSIGFSVEEDSNNLTLSSHVLGDMVNGVFNINKSDIISRAVLTSSDVKDYLSWKESQETPVEETDELDYVTVEVKPQTLTEVLSGEKETLMVVPDNFHGINVSNFIEDYPTMSQNKLIQKYKSTYMVVSTLISILKRLGKISTEERTVNSIIVEHETPKKESKLGKTKKVQKNSFKARVNKKQFLKDVKKLGIRDLCAKYGVSDYTIYDAIKYFEAQDKETDDFETSNKSKIDMLISRKTEISRLAPTSTQGYLARKFGVSQYTMNTALKRMGIKTAGR